MKQFYMLVLFFIALNILFIISGSINKKTEEFNTEGGPLSMSTYTPDQISMSFLNPNGTTDERVVIKKDGSSVVNGRLLVNNDLVATQPWVNESSQPRWDNIRNRPTSVVGPAGPMGPKGDMGAQGLQGPTGPKGDTGAQGLRGPAGPQGERGFPGPTGPQGQQGPQGFLGPAGPKGDKGDKGDRGPTGPQGERGLQGAQGVPGERGLQGLKGDTGLQGPQGNPANIGLDPRFNSITTTGDITAKNRNVLAELDGKVGGEYEQFTRADQPVERSGGWTLGGDWPWDPAFRGGRVGYAHTDRGDGDASNSDRWIDYNVPANMKQAYVVHLPWSNCRYFDIFGRNGNEYIFIKRVNSFNPFTDPKPNNHHPGTTAVGVAGVNRFSRIRIQGRFGQIHLMGIGWTREEGRDMETGYVHWDNVYGAKTAETTFNNRIVVNGGGWDASFAGKHPSYFTGEVAIGNGDGSGTTHFNHMNKHGNFIRGRTQFDGGEVVINNKLTTNNRINTSEQVHASHFNSRGGMDIAGEARLNANQNYIARHIDATSGWGRDNGKSLFAGWASDKVVLGNNVNGSHDWAFNAPKGTVVSTNPLVFPNNGVGIEFRGSTGGGPVSHIFDNGHLRIHTDDNMYLKGTQVDVEGTLRVNNEVQVDKRNTIHLGVNEGKEAHAGKIGFRTFSGDSLDIVGAGNNNQIRNVRVFDRMTINADQSLMLNETRLKVGGNIWANNGDVYARKFIVYPGDRDIVAELNNLKAEVNNLNANAVRYGQTISACQENGHGCLGMDPNKNYFTGNYWPGQAVGGYERFKITRQ